jgi:hypothetical protein
VAVVEELLEEAQVAIALQQEHPVEVLVLKTHYIFQLVLSILSLLVLAVLEVQKQVLAVELQFLEATEIILLLQQ